MQELFSLKGKNVVLTGGCGNLGRIMAKHLLDFDAKVFIVDVIDTPLPELEGRDVHYIKCDLGSTESIQAMYAKVEEIGGKMERCQRVPDLCGNTGKQGYQFVLFRFHERLLSGAKALRIAFTAE